MPVKFLYRQLCRLSTLRAAWTRVEESDGCAGIDSVTISRFADNLDQELLRLSDELAGSQYKPLPLMRFFITKSDGGQRPLSVPVVRDRVAQSAALILIEPRFEQEFENCSFAYRKGHSVQQALQQVERLREAGYAWVVEADITAYFCKPPAITPTSSQRFPVFGLTNIPWASDGPETCVVVLRCTPSATVLFVRALPTSFERQTYRALLHGSCD